MWGFGGWYYWGRKNSLGRETGPKLEGIVVIFAWMSSEEKHLKHYVDLYASLGWDSLVCHSQFLNSFFPEKATVLATEVLDELVKEIKIQPRPIVLASFSGGPKACMYKVLQIIDGKSGNQSNSEYYRLTRDCIAGHIYDSSPVDFVSEMGTRFILHPSILKMSRPPKLVTWIAHGVASGIDAIFLTRFESDRADFWQTLYASVSMRAPYLFLCSEDDDLAPCQTICSFAQRLEELGGDVTLVKWFCSPHVGHYREHPADYQAAVTHLLQKASLVYSQRIQQRGGEKTIPTRGSVSQISDPFGHLRRGAEGDPTDELRRAASNIDLPLLLPSSSGYQEGSSMGSIQDSSATEGSIQPHIPQAPGLNAQGVLGQILYDICVPKNVDDWDIKRPSSPFDAYTPIFPAPRRNLPFNPIKCFRRSRL